MLPGEQAQVVVQAAIAGSPSSAFATKCARGAVYQRGWRRSRALARRRRICGCPGVVLDRRRLLPRRGRDLFPAAAVVDYHSVGDVPPAGRLEVIDVTAPWEPPDVN